MLGAVVAVVGAFDVLGVVVTTVGVVEVGADVAVVDSGGTVEACPLVPHAESRATAPNAATTVEPVRRIVAIVVSALVT